MTNAMKDLTTAKDALENELTETLIGLHLARVVAMFEEAEDEDSARVEPFCACGRIISRCDGSRRGCLRPRRLSTRRR